MKRTIVILFLLTTAAFSLQAQTAPDANELTRMLNEFLAGAGRNDVAIHDNFWADDLIYTRGVGVRIGKEELMKGVRSAPAAKPGDDVTVYTAEDIRIQQYGNAAVVAFKLVGTTTKAIGTKTVSNHLNTGTFIKRNGKWQAVAWQATMVPTQEKAAQPSGNAATTTPVVTLPSTGARTYVKGSRGGCYYLSPTGAKIYVSRDLCK